MSSSVESALAAAAREIELARFGPAEAMLRELLQGQPANLQAMYLLSCLMSLTGRVTDGVDLCFQALRQREDIPVFHLHLAEMLRKTGDLHRALDHAQRAVSLSGARDSAALVSLGSVQFQLGRYNDATASFSTALELKPHDPTAIRGLAEAAICLNRFSQAENALRGGLEADQDNPILYDRLAFVLRKLERYDDAIDAQRRAVQIDPDGAEYWVQLGNMLEQAGESQEGHNAFETAFRLKPSCVPALLGLVQTTSDKLESSKQLDLLAPFLARADGLEGSERISIHLALFETYDKLGRFDEAFPHLIEANALKRAATEYDEAATLGLVRDIQNLITRDAVREKAGAGNSSDAPIFIVGMPRSGTTLVEQILASHRDVAAGGERKILRNLATMPIQAGDAIRPYPYFVPGASPAQLERLGNAYVQQLRAVAPQARHVTDKLPGNSLFLGLIHLILPNAKIILVNRDPADVCLSCFAKFLLGSQNFTYDLGELGRFYRSHDALMNHWRHILPEGSILDVQYENLVGDFENEARRLLRFCGLAWDPRILEFHKSTRTVRTVSTQQVRRPLYASSVGRWRHYRKYLGPLLAELDSSLSSARGPHCRARMGSARC